MFVRIGTTPVEVGITEDFVRDVAGLIKPGTSVLFVLDEGGDMDVILHSIRGLGGAVLKTNVGLERATLIQSTVAASAAATQPNGQFVESILAVGETAMKKPRVPVHEPRATCVENDIEPRAYFVRCVGRSDRRVQEQSWSDPEDCEGSPRFRGELCVDRAAGSSFSTGEVLVVPRHRPTRGAFPASPAQASDPNGTS
jgi:hypothetical protein